MGGDEYSRHGEWIRLLFDFCHDREIMKRMVDIYHWYHVILFEKLSMEEGKINKILENYTLGIFEWIQFIDFKIWFDSAIQAFELTYLKMLHVGCRKGISISILYVYILFEYLFLFYI